MFSPPLDQGYDRQRLVYVLEWNTQEDHDYFYQPFFNLSWQTFHLS